jgi:hypothetical protein
MTSLLGELLTNLVDYVITGVVTVINLISSGIETVLTGLLAVLPAMPEPIKGSSITGLSWFNWFLPVGAILTIFFTLMTMYISYLAIAWALRFVRAT